MKYIIIFDTEYTSWKGCNENGWDESKGQYKEIIQIAALKFDLLNNEIVDEFDILVKPTMNKKLSKYIKELTKIEQEKIDIEGYKFDEGLSLFLDFIGNDDIASYGYDLGVINQNYSLLDKKSPFKNKKYIELRNIFSDYSSETKKYSSGELNKFFNINMDGHVHNAMFDCMSLLESLKALSDLKNRKIKDILLNKKE